MKTQWQEYSQKFQQISSREQYLILLTGLVAVFFIIFHLFIDPVIVSNNKLENKIVQLTSSNKTLSYSINDTKMALRGDPNEAIHKKIAQFETKLARVDTKLLKLTSDLINPIQMRHALLGLLKLNNGVSLLSFELLEVQPLLTKPNISKIENEHVSHSFIDDKTGDEVTNNTLIKDSNINSKLKTDDSQLNLYRHAIKLKLSGGYFELRDYLLQLEQLKWQFFWQNFNFEVQEYPQSELEVIIYSLSTKQEFVGV